MEYPSRAIVVGFCTFVVVIFRFDSFLLTAMRSAVLHLHLKFLPNRLNSNDTAGQVDSEHPVDEILGGPTQVDERKVEEEEEYFEKTKKKIPNKGGF